MCYSFTTPWYYLYVRTEYVPVNKPVSPTQTCCLHSALIILFPLPPVSYSIFPEDSATIDHPQKSFMLNWNVCIFYCLSRNSA